MTSQSLNVQPMTTFPAPAVTYLTRKGYVFDKEGNEALVDHLKEFLTVTPRVNPNMPNAANAISFPVYQESLTRIYIPKAFGLKTFGEPSRDLIGHGVDAPGLKFKGSLREEQKAPAEAFLKAARDPTRRGGLLILPCAFGKTALSLYLASQIGKKTLVVCHKGFLIDQWKDRISAFLPTARVGTIKQSVIDVKDKDIVIGSLQSIAFREYPKETFSDIGMTIFDEVHHTSAERFSQCLPKTTSNVMLGLTATPNRKDGLRKVFEWFIGKPVFTVRKRTETSLIVHSQAFRHYDPDGNYGREIRNYNGQINFAGMINAVCACKERNQYIVECLEKVLATQPDRHVLIMSERKNQLKELDKILRQRSVANGSIGYYVGGMKADDMTASTTKQIMLATVQICSEGFDVPTLNTLVLASPISSIEQPIGRIQRQKPEERKYTPLVLDIWDQYSVFYRQGQSRLKFYADNGYVIHRTSNTASSEVEVEEPTTTTEYSETVKADFIEDDE